MKLLKYVFYIYFIVVSLGVFSLATTYELDFYTLLSWVACGLATYLLAANKVGE